MIYMCILYINLFVYIVYIMCVSQSPGARAVLIYDLSGAVLVRGLQFVCVYCV